MTENRDSVTARRASDEKKPTKEAKPDCRKGAQRREELGRRRAEDLREAHSAEQSDKEVSRRKRAQPTAGEKSIANCRREEHSQQQAGIKTTERAVPTAG